MADTLTQYQSAPFNGPMSLFAQLIDMPANAAAPFEGLWLPCAFAKTGSVELTGTFSAISCDVLGTNQPNPVNTYVLTLGGTINATDVINLVFTPGNVAPFTVSYTVVAGDTTTTILAGHIAAAINGSAVAQGLGIKAVGGSGTITVTWPSVAPGTGTPEFQPPSSPPPQSTLTISYTQGGNAETIAVAVGTDGTKLVTTLTAAGLSGLSLLPCRWIKARLNSLTGSVVNVNYSGSA
jgi:hypothetical protein